MDLLVHGSLRYGATSLKGIPRETLVEKTMRACNDYQSLGELPCNYMMHSILEKSSSGCGEWDGWSSDKRNWISSLKSRRLASGSDSCWSLRFFAQGLHHGISCDTRNHTMLIRSFLAGEVFRKFNLEHLFAALLKDRFLYDNTYSVPTIDCIGFPMDSEPFFERNCLPLDSRAMLSIECSVSSARKQLPCSLTAKMPWIEPAHCGRSVNTQQVHKHIRTKRVDIIFVSVKMLALRNPLQGYKFLLVYEAIFCGGCASWDEKTGCYVNRRLLGPPWWNWWQMFSSCWAVSLLRPFSSITESFSEATWWASCRSSSLGFNDDFFYREPHLAQAADGEHGRALQRARWLGNSVSI